MLTIGEKAPDFELPDQNGEVHKLSDSKGKLVFLYFYPRDDTPGCTFEACSVRDNLGKIESKGVQVFGVSTDTVKSHKKFEQKFQLNFTLLADSEKKTVDDYQVWAEKVMMGRRYQGILRTSFLIDPEGKIVKVYEKVKPEGHIDEVIEDLKNLQKS